MSDRSQPISTLDHDGVVPPELTRNLPVKGQSAMEDGSASVQSTAHTAKLGFTNNFPVTLDWVELMHRYGSETPEIHRWHGVAPKVSTTPDPEPHYWAGLCGLARADYECDLKDEDDVNNGGPIHASITGYTFNPNLRSGSSGASIVHYPVNPVAAVPRRHHIPDRPLGVQQRHLHAPRVGSKNTRYLANNLWARRVTLLEGLQVIASFPNFVIALVIKDRLSPAMRAKVKDKFQAAGLDSLIYKKTLGTPWPRLKDMFNRCRLVVFNSAPTADFMLQWDHLAENHYGDRSLEPSTWVQKRRESRDIGGTQMPLLLAMNHFPDLPVLLGIPWQNFNRINGRVLLKSHIDDFEKVKGGLVLNFVNADFIDWREPELGCLWAVRYCHFKLHGRPPPPP
ncbi:hypothetical protein B0T21DRAFT_443735 [Apiosordaria backusii]|uniref:Uncharacterized protein n=1 Tax=Apiosordaria backusii TaxID=314023 RepID=A0AA40EBX0_9PEZI|nr:hypothetical protein B0T21DRAFT_443735 [Apiosordaria backusii]